MADIYLGSTDLSGKTFKMGSSDVSALYMGSTKLWEGTNYIPVAGYVAYLDFMDSPMTLNGSRIAQINDLSGNGYNAVQSNTSVQPYWNASGYYDGQNTTNANYLDWSSADAIMNGLSPRTNDYTVVVGTDENSHRRQPFGLGGGSDDRLEFFYNDSVGRRDYVGFNRQVNFFSTNNTSKDIILFGESDASNISIYGRMATEQSSTTTTNWASDTVSGGTTSRIGYSARGALTTPSDCWKGKIYFIAVYQKHLTLSERADIATWAVSKWGLTLT